MIDDDTDVSTRECEIICARVIFNGRCFNVLVGHIEVKHAHVEGMWLPHNDNNDQKC